MSTKRPGKYRVLLVQEFAEFTNEDGTLDQLDAPEAAEWLDARDAKPRAAVDMLIDAVSEAPEGVQDTLNALLLRALRGDLKLDDAAALRDVLRAALVDATKAEINREIPSVVNVPGIRAAARDEALELRRRGITPGDL